MADIDLLYAGLDREGIEKPGNNARTSNGFMRWGKNDRYWAKEVDDGYLFGDFSQDISEHIFPHSDETLSPEERRQRARQIERARQEIAENLKKQQEATAQEALKRWQRLPQCENHPYLRKKQVPAYRLRVDGDCLVIPLYDRDGKIWSLQYINKEGEKRFLSGGKTKGCFFPIGKIDDTIIICEGYATSASIYQATHKAVAVAFNVGNLESVILALKNKYPDKKIILAADNDIKENAPNIGVLRAKELGNKYSCKVIIPELLDGGKCDFNDVAVNDGLERVKAFFDGENRARVNPQISARVESLPAGFCLTNDSLLYTGGDGDPLKVSGRIEVIAGTRDNNSKNWGKLLKFVDPDGVLKEIAVPNTMFAGDCKELRERLLSEGLTITPAGKTKLSTYLMSCNPTARVLCVNKTGWYQNAFVFPDSIIGKTEDKISFQTESFNNVYATAGSLEQWRENIGKYCSGNNRLIFAVSAAFASALLDKSGIESGGFHFVGGSSCGKSTILRVAASVWGDENYLRTWRATDNGLEGIAALHNDSLLVLDELGQVDPAKAGEIAYMLGNGGGKTRSTRNGNARNALSWRLLYLSSGEKDLNDCAVESKKKVKAGQEVRLLNIPAVPLEGEHFGAFEYLHDFGNGGAFAEYLNRQVKSYYGTPARAFIKSITEENQEELNKHIREKLNMLKEGLNEDITGNEADNQVNRAINRFALVAYAGEYATANELTGWQKDEACYACAQCLKDWLTARGGVGNQEDKEILDQVKYFFEQHSESRFYNLMAGSDQKIINMAGYKDKVNEKWEYYVLPSVFKNDVCSGLNLNLAKEALTKKGWLKSEESKSKRIGDEVKKVYIFNSELWCE